MDDLLNIRRVDQTALKFNQAAIIALLLVAFVFNWVWLVVLVAGVMIVGTLWPRAGLFKYFYAQVLRPLGLLKADVIPADPQPHLFAQGLGGLVLVLALAAWAVGLTTVTWALVGVVIVLAGINLVAGFCLGCFVYYQLARRGISANLPQWQAAAVPAKKDSRGHDR